ncbi:MAG: hypothetical protein IJB94_00065 [Clostridia bacterium]|nr:hypothetical protein [Clostridia bacterium]
MVKIICSSPFGVDFIDYSIAQFAHFCKPKSEKSGANRSKQKKSAKVIEKTKKLCYNKLGEYGSPTDFAKIPKGEKI